MTEEIKDIKSKRILNFREFCNKILNYLTDNNIVKGNIILFTHLILLSIYCLLVFFFQ